MFVFCFHSSRGFQWYFSDTDENTIECLNVMAKVYIQVLMVNFEIDFFRGRHKFHRLEPILNW